MLGNIFNRSVRTASLFLTLAVLLTPPVQSAEAAEFNPVRKHPTAQASEPLVQRVIVKLRAPDAERARMQSATSVEESTAANSRVQALAQRTGHRLKQSRPISERMQLLL